MAIKQWATLMYESSRPEINGNDLIEKMREREKKIISFVIVLEWKYAAWRVAMPITTPNGIEL